MTATIVDIGTLIVRAPDICGDRPRIAGKRITVGRIATLWKQGLTPEEIADNWGYSQHGTSLRRPYLLSRKSARDRASFTTRSRRL